MGYVRQLYLAAKAASRLKGYVPRKVAFRDVLRWYRQYPRSARDSLAKLLSLIEFYDEQTVVRALVEGNRSILNSLAQDGIEPSNVIYVQHDQAGSSSGVMLHLLRDAAQLQLRGSVLLDGKDKDAISAHTKRLNVGAIIYVDDFAGSGNQFISNRNDIAQYVAGSFSEFFLSVVVCEEALMEMQNVHVAAKAHRLHWKNERPLLQDCGLLGPEDREILCRLSDDCFGESAMGYEGLATNVVFYRNCPDSTPRLIRGSAGQNPHAGILPRTTDLALA